MWSREVNNLLLWIVDTITKRGTTERNWVQNGFINSKKECIVFMWFTWPNTNTKKTPWRLRLFGVMRGYHESLSLLIGIAIVFGIISNRAVYSITRASTTITRPQQRPKIKSMTRNFRDSWLNRDEDHLSAFIISFSLFEQGDPSISRLVRSKQCKSNDQSDHHHNFVACCNLDSYLFLSSTATSQGRRGQINKNT